MIEKVFNKIAISWDHIPIVSKLDKGLILDGYWLNDFNGFAVVIYDPEKDRLLRWVDPNAIPTARYIGGVPENVSEYRIKIKKLYSLLEDKEVTVSEVPVSEVGLSRNNNVNLKKNPSVDNYSNHVLTYFQVNDISPGLWYKFNKLSIGNIKYENAQELSDEIRSRMLGEPESIIALCEENLPVLQSPVGNIKRAAFDIEVKSSRDVFPLPSEAEYEVHAVAFYDNENNAFMYYTGFPPKKYELELIKEELGYMPQITVCSNERTLLSHVFNKMQEYPVLLSYNGDNFDMPYLLNRATKINSQMLIKYGKNKYDRLKLDIPIFEGHYRGKNKEYQVRGVIHLDLFRFFNNNSVRLYAYSGKYSRTRLDDVSEALLGYKKVHHDLWFDEMTRDQIVAYTVRDVELTLRLSTFSDNLTINLMFVLMRVGKFSITFLNRESISRWILNWVAFEHKRNNYLMPNAEEIERKKGGFTSTADSDGKQYQGAIVLDPKSAGTYWNVLVADFASLYPSIIKKYRLSYETMRCEHDECKSNVVPYLDHWVCLRQQGIMSTLVGYVRDIRVKWFKPLTRSKDKEEALFAKTVQAALKVFINASYGVFGNKNFTLFCPPLAESTTAYARSALLESKRLAEEMGLDVLYGDTDSIFIHKPTEKQFMKLKVWSVVTLGIELGIDYRFRFLVLSGRKKNYFGVTTDNGIIVKGLQVKKSNTAIFIRKTFEEITDILSKVENQQDMEIALERTKNLIRAKVIQLKKGEIPLIDLAAMATLRNSFEDYKSVTPAVQIAIQKIGEEETDIKKGAQFMIVSVRPFNVMVRTDKFRLLQMGTVRECNVKDIADIKNHREVNIGKYIKSMASAFKPIFDAFDLSWDDVITPKIPLENYF